MPIYQIILVIAVVILVLSLLLNLLFSPITWIIIAILVIYSFIRRYLYEKQLKEAEQQLLLARRNMDATQDMYASGMASEKELKKKSQRKKLLINQVKLTVMGVTMLLM